MSHKRDARTPDQPAVSSRAERLQPPVLEAELPADVGRLAVEDTETAVLGLLTIVLARA